ncbi:SDR family oxidoreductase [Pelagerythrobacter marinus]|uniref:SDR family oxidoreductase n=1 Tax=Pelagerythrobacter marinus TaxID=538382 RepID=UPI002AC8E2F2|nr:SDR family oxidoreductase [Pelagerythrobacter marinus]WPZ07583.1 SDR family oxidoreductase [Pelagerythrobacter marinus]
MDLENKTIIITGASSGIGATAATLFARAGANLVLGARRSSELERVAAEARRQGARAVAVPGDVTDPDYADALVGLAQKDFGGLDGAFNNAGIVGDMLPASEMSVENWNDVIATNLTSAFYAAKAQIPALLHRGRGALVFTSSFVGVSNGGLSGMAAYAASKAGIIGLVKSLASDHAEAGIRVNALLPGGTVTPAGGEGNPEALAFIASLHPMKRMAAPAEIAEAALFLLSDRATFVTGSAMVVDGGISVRLA